MFPTKCDECINYDDCSELKKMITVLCLEFEPDKEVD